MSRLYTYLPKDNTALKDGILSTVLTDNGFKHYRTRTGKYKKEDKKGDVVSSRIRPRDWKRRGLLDFLRYGYEKKASAKIDIPSVYDEVRKAYADMGYPVSGDRLVLSEQPTYVDGRPVPADVLNPRSSGGNTQHDGTVRINPRYRAVMRHWKIKGPGRDFLRTIIGHELGHHIDRSVLSKPEHAEERKRLLKEIVKAKFHTVYTDSYGPDTDPRKLDKELLAEYLAKMVRHKLEKKAQAEEILAKAKTHYPESGSHGWNHIEDVMASAERMRRRKLLLKELAAIAYHDSSLMTGPRETHADDSAAIAGDELKAYFRKRQLKDIVNAIAHHRASYEGRRASKLEDLVAAADRNPPDFEKDVMRSFRYGMEHGLGVEGAVANTLQHMPDKYGTKGYAYRNVPKIYMDTYGDDVRKVQKAFDALTADDIRRIAGIGKRAQAGFLARPLDVKTRHML